MINPNNFITGESSLMYFIYIYRERERERDVSEAIENLRWIFYFDTHLACAIVILVHRTVVGEAVSQYLQSSTGMQHPENIGYQPTFLMAQPQLRWPLIHKFKDGAIFCWGSRTELWAHTPSIAFWHPPPNPARFSYATEGVLLISAQLSTDAVSALWKVWVLIWL